MTAARLTPDAKRATPPGLALRLCKSFDTRGANIANTMPARPPAPPTRSIAVLISGRSLPGRRGSSPINREPNPNREIVASSAIAEIAAEARPTASGENRRAANHQYTKPRADVMRFVQTKDAVLVNITRFVFTHRKSTVLTARNCSRNISSQYLREIALETFLHNTLQFISWLCACHARPRDSVHTLAEPPVYLIEAFL